MAWFIKKGLDLSSIEVKADHGTCLQNNGLTYLPIDQGPAHTFCVATRLCEGLAVCQQCNSCHGHPKHTSILARLILK